MRAKLLFAGAALALSLATGAAAAGPTLYGATYSGAPDSSLYTLDQSTGAATLVGAIGQNIGDLTNMGGALVGVDLTNNALWTINTATGAASNQVSITGTRGTITSIAWDPVSHTMYGDTTSAFSGSDLLYTIDTTTGAASLVGALGATDVYGLGFSQTGALFGTDSLGELLGVNTSTGGTSLIGATGFGSVFDLASRPGDGTMFATPGNNGLLTLNTATGVGSTVGPFGPSLNIAGLAFVGGVPEPSGWAMMIVGVGLAGAAMRARRKAAGAAAA